MVQTNSTSRYLAIAAMRDLMDDHQGNQIIDDGIWDSIYGAEKDDDKAKEIATQELQKMVEMLAEMLGIKTVSESGELTELWHKGMEEIEEHFG